MEGGIQLWREGFNRQSEIPEDNILCVCQLPGMELVQLQLTNVEVNHGSVITTVNNSDQTSGANITKLVLLVQQDSWNQTLREYLYENQPPVLERGSGRYPGVEVYLAPRMQVSVSTLDTNIIP